MRQRDVVAGFGFFVFINISLLALIVLGSDVLGHDGSHDAKVGFGIIAVAEKTQRILDGGCQHHAG